MNATANMSVEEAKTSFKEKIKYRSSGPSCVYMLGVIGAAVYFISNATGFWMGVAGFFKALVWPAIFVYEALSYFA